MPNEVGWNDGLVTFLCYDPRLYVMKLQLCVVTWYLSCFNAEC